MVSKSIYMQLHLNIIGGSTVTYGYECHKIKPSFPRKCSQEENTPKYFETSNIKCYGNALPAIPLDIALASIFIAVYPSDHHIIALKTLLPLHNSCKK